MSQGFATAMQRDVLPAAQRLVTALQQWAQGQDVSVFDREFLVRAIGKYAPESGYRLLNRLEECNLPPMPAQMRNPVTMFSFV